MVRRILMAVLLVLGASTAAAQTAEDRLEAALVHWRAASWYVRLGNTDVAALEVDSFREKWRAVAEGPASIAGMADNAALALETNDPVTAGRTLAAIGDTLAEARRAAGSAGFPEAIRAYRDAVERLGGMMTMSEHRGSNTFEPALKAEVRAAVVEVRQRAAALSPATPPRWQNDASFHGLVRQNMEGIAAVLAAIDRPQPPAIGLEVAGLISVARANYNLLFLSYGY
jgi:hypothetical protein